MNTIDKTESFWYFLAIKDFKTCSHNIPALTAALNPSKYRTSSEECLPVHVTVIRAPARRGGQPCLLATEACGLYITHRKCCDRWSNVIKDMHHACYIRENVKCSPAFVLSKLVLERDVDTVFCSFAFLHDLLKIGRKCHARCKSHNECSSFANFHI